MYGDSLFTATEIQQIKARLYPKEARKYFLELVLSSCMSSQLTYNDMHPILLSPERSRDSLKRWHTIKSVKLFTFLLGSHGSQLQSQQPE